MARSAAREAADDECHASQARATVAPTARRIVCRLTVPSKRDGVMRCRITDAPARER